MNWKTCFLPLLLAAVMLGSVTAFADGEPAAPPAVQNEAQTALAAGEPITEGNLTYTVNDDGQTVTLTDGSNATGAITIPDAIEKGGTSYPVTSIWDTAFAYCWQLVSVTFSGNIDSIGDFAFENCGALESVTFSGKVDSIGGRAFEDCDALKTIYVPASMPEETVQIIRDALTGSGLPDVQIVQPEQPSDPSTDPSTPSVPSTGTTGSASTAVQQLEAAERPDPMDEQATERYNFWMDVKSDLRAAGDGRTVRVYVPADYTNMPASVMETIRTLGKEITIDLRWNGQRLIITPQTALQRPALKAFWTLSQLCEEYAR